VLLSDVAVKSAIFYKSGRWDFVVPPRASASATATPDDEDNDGGGGLMGMVAVGATTACVTGAFCERVLVGGGVGGSNGDNANDAAGTKDADPPVVAVTSIHLDAQSEERWVHQLSACLEDGGGEGESSVMLIPTTKTARGVGGADPDDNNDNDNDGGRRGTT
jgi:hypothetical protein